MTADDSGAVPRSVLMIAYHFPPLAGSSGIQRTLRFVQHLPRFGWQASVLTAQPQAYERTSDDLLGEVPAGVLVRRAFALDAARHLAIRGRYFGAWARPDRWANWRFDAVRQGLRLVAARRPDVIWSTYPIATAHRIGAELHRRTGIPWVADFRDPMAQEGYPADPRVHASFVDIERLAMTHAAVSVFTTPGAAETYRRRYPQRRTRIEVVENGFDEEAFAVSEAAQPQVPALNPGMTTLLHSGIVYPDERDPTALFEALGRLLASGAVAPTTLRLRFRAAVHDDLLHRLAQRFGVDELIETLPPLPYRAALTEMRGADALLAMQAANCNEQIPGKVYEYLRAGRPIVCLADAAGDTAGLLRRAGVDCILPLDSADAIADGLPEVLQQIEAGRATLPAPDVVRAASRQGRTGLLATHLSTCLR